MENIIAISVGLGVIVSLIFSEFFGIIAGGLVVPGYIAIYMNNPLTIVYTIIVSFVTYFLVHSISSVVIIYGRRRTALMILVGFLLGEFVRTIGSISLGNTLIEFKIVGYIIPGLIAMWMDKEGIIETITSLTTSSIIVRLLLILFFGTEIL